MADQVFPHDPEDLAYAAGIIDGEGSIGITELSPRYEPSNRRARRRSPSIRAFCVVIMADPNVPWWLAETFGGTVQSYGPRQPGYRGSFHWKLSGARAAAFLQLIVDRLKVKRQQAELVMAYYADPRFVFKQRQGIPIEEIEQRREYVGRAKALNRGGQ